MEERQTKTEMFLHKDVEIDKLIDNGQYYSLASHSYQKGWEDAINSKSVKLIVLENTISKIKTIHLLISVNHYRRQLEKIITKLEDQIKLL